MILVSSCIMGNPCRYDGKAAINEEAVRELATSKILKVCPEVMAGLPTPRIPMEIKDEGAHKNVYSKEGNDFTAQFSEGAKQTLNLCKKHNIAYAILKDKSPSCGSQYIYSGFFDSQLISGMGITAKLLSDNGIQVFSSETAPYKKIKVYDFLVSHGIAFTKHEHEPVFTVEEANKMEINIQAQQCKNLFLRNKKGDRHFLVILEHNRPFNLKQFGQDNDLGRLSFASPKRLNNYLQVEPGSVSAFALINDVNHEVEVYIDRDFDHEQNISFHPNQNDETLEITFPDFEKFMISSGHTYKLC